MPGLLVHDGINESNPRDLQLYIFSEGEEIKVGKGENCEIILDDPEVGEVHAIFSYTSGGIWRIKAFSDDTIIRVNSKEIAMKKLRNGDKIQMGNSLVQFFDMILIGSKLPILAAPEKLPPPAKDPIMLKDEPLTLEGEDLLEHPYMVPPGIYLTHGGILGEYIHIKGQVLLGRSSQCTLVFRDVDVSRTHASLEVDSDGKVILTDLASRNGVFVNDRRIVDRCTLNGFDLVRLGNTEFIFLENEKNLEMFKKLVRRGSILLKKVSLAGEELQGIVPGSAEGGGPKKSLVEVFRKEEKNREKEEKKPSSAKKKESPPPKEISSEEGVVCTTCGESNLEEAKFCNHCGNKLVTQKVEIEQEGDNG
ncbi:MAG: FHA domain-containing protein [Planctomycetota bacterium]|nr:MAG: FHA domain-containing protein [Planctomycetota bacterium]